MHNMGNWTAVLNALSPFVLPTRIDRIRKQLSFRVVDTILVLDNLDKEMNIHACLRTAEALGLQYVYVLSSSSNKLLDTRSVSKGAQKWLSLRYFTDTNECISLLRRDKYLIAASDIGSISVDVETAAARTLSMLRNGNESDCFRQRVAVVMGNEMRGCSPSILNAADTLFFIPQAGFSQSLNVSVATAISLNCFLNRTKDYAQLSLHAHKTRVLTGNTTPVYTRSDSLTPPFVEPLCDAAIDEVLARVLLSNVPAASAILKRAGVSELELK